ncbi:uncharacterized protein BO80DRAFT_32563 [Aspergillus ibericus CBS 121593]|uniref:Uncharacterized protein n=1 Tax=Aspergillus ibericus CBS 121593 TaxID=1448316 RepID=A0A395H4H6_9EURO|nr:hypothetical protein BO80DRAFT_32563 [Aspergillus ibericus CBS 121593]RAL02349.1 hypothetical protein BO80DRAFT_32563 [Aspergillus ibericus CBS 121593]
MHDISSACLGPSVFDRAAAIPPSPIAHPSLQALSPEFPPKLSSSTAPLYIRQRMHRWLSSIFPLLLGFIALILFSRFLSTLFLFPRTFLPLFLFWPSLLFLPWLLLLLQHRSQHFRHRWASIDVGGRSTLRRLSACLDLKPTKLWSSSFHPRWIAFFLRPVPNCRTSDRGLGALASHHLDYPILPSTLESKSIVNRPLPG